VAFIGFVYQFRRVCVFAVLKDRLSPEDHSNFCALLAKYLDGAGEGQDQMGGGPPAFSGMPLRGGEMSPNPHERPHFATDSAAFREFEADFPEAARLSRSDDGYGTPCPMRPQQTPRQQRLALDSKTAGGESAHEQFQREWPEISRIRKSY
jgi:hypothetical protein